MRSPPSPATAVYAAAHRATRILVGAALGVALALVAVAGGRAEVVAAGVHDGKLALTSDGTPFVAYVRGGSVQAEGDLDFRGTLGVERGVPVGFQRIRLTFTLDTDADDEQLATLLRLTERYCVVLQTLRTGPEIHVSRQR